MAKKEPKSGGEKLDKYTKIGGLVFFIGIVVSILAGFITIPYIAIILVASGLIVGTLNIKEEEVQGFLIASIAILLVGSAGLQVLVGIGVFIESILKNVVSFVAPATLIVALKSIWKLARG